MGLEKDTLLLIFPPELLKHFEIVLAHELGDIKAKEDFVEVVFEEKNILPVGVDGAQYESKGFYSKLIQDFPIRGKAVFLKINGKINLKKLYKFEIKNLDPLNNKFDLIFLK